MLMYLLIALNVGIFLILLALFAKQLLSGLSQSRLEQTQHSADLKEQLQQAFANHRSRFDERQMETLKILQDTLQKGVQDNREQVKEALNDYAKELGKRVEQLTQTTENKLKEITRMLKSA